MLTTLNEIPGLLQSIGAGYWLALFGVLTLLFFARALAFELRSGRAREALQAKVSSKRLRQLLASPSAARLEPVERVVTLMFIDIVGFSASAEKETPASVFRSLRETMNSLTEMVHRNGGVVDKIVGDGMLCFFGYDYDGQESSPGHADQAMTCALEMQLDNLTSISKSTPQFPIFPLRIGINTAPVYLGDGGNSHRIELTLIGHGVALAKRLEMACEPFCILLSASTRAQLSRPELLELEKSGGSLRRRFIESKPFGELLEAYECLPAAEQRSLHFQALTVFRSYTSSERAETRWPLPAGVAIRVTTQHGTGILRDFSLSGFSIELNEYLGVGVILSISLDMENSRLKSRLEALGVLPVVCEVRWGRAAEGELTAHGVLIKNLSPAQKQILLNELRNAISGGATQSVAA